MKKSSAPSSPPQASASPEPEKKKPKKPKKSESKPEAPKSPAPAKVTPPKNSPPSKSPAPQPAKQPKSPKSPSDDEKPAELTKTQLQKLKKKQKKETEEKAKAEEKALEVKREAAAAKKAAKQAQKKKEVASPTQAQAFEDSKEDVEEELEEGWERPSARKTFKISKGPNDKKKLGSKSKDLPDKKASAPKVVANVQVEKKRHGNVIGPKGAFLKLIQERTGAKITMPKREGGGLGVVIEGSATEVAAAEIAIKEIAAKGYCSITHPETVSNTITLEDPGLVGRIAGPKGENLRKIQSGSGATLQLPDKKSAHAVITISGKPSEILNARVAIMDLINQGYSNYTHPGWAAEEFDLDRKSVV